MFKRFLSSFALCFILFVCTNFSSIGQTLRPSVIASGGGYSMAGGNSISWTTGETFFSSLQNGSVLLTQGEQQSFIHLRLLNLKLFIEGYYNGGSQMAAVLFNSDTIQYFSNVCDSITVELRYPTPPYELAAVKKTILLTNGTALLHFTESLPVNNYYIVIHHRNSIETWSKTPVLFNGNTVNFDFTSM